MQRLINSRGLRVGIVAAFFMAAFSGVAWARTGYVSNPKSVVFYYGETAGSGADSDNFDGYGSVRLCMGSTKGGGNNTYVGRYLWNRSLQPDDEMRTANVRYGAGSYASSAFNTPSDRRYHTEATWSAVPAASNDANGFVASRTSSLSCP